MLKTKRFILTIVLLLTCGVSARAQQGVSLEPSTILLGDQCTLTTPAPLFFSTEALTQNDIVPVRQWFDTLTDEQGRKQVLQRTLLTSFEEGEHWLKLSDNDSLLLAVEDVPNVDTASLDIKDIAAPFREPYTFWEIFRWVLLALGVALLIAAIIYMVRRIKNKQPIIALPQAPPKPADQQALEHLEQLRQRQLWQQGKVKEYHTELTDTLRGYLLKAFGINSAEMTSDQTLEAFEGCRIHTQEDEELLRQVLQTADMVKFAKSTPLPYEHDRSMEHAVNFVKHTWGLEAQRKQQEAEQKRKEVQQ